MGKKHFLFDMDDTLFPTDLHYVNAEKEFKNLLRDTIGVSGEDSLDSIVKSHRNRQMRLISKVGFNREVFPQALKYTYFHTAIDWGLSSEVAIEGSNIAYKIGQRVFDKDVWATVKTYPGTEEVLDYLKNSGVDLSMITLGDYNIQREKVKFYGLDKWFFGDNINSVLKEKGSKIREIASRFDKKDVYFVGNSARSDIEPSVKAGINAIYIPQNTWSYDGRLKFDVSRVRVLKGISEIPALYDSLR